MLEGAAHCGHPIALSQVVDPELGGRGPGVRESALVSVLLERLDRSLQASLVETWIRLPRMQSAADATEREERVRLEPFVARRARLLERLLEDRLGAGELERPGERLAEVDEQGQPLGVVVLEQLDRAFEQADGRGEVPACEGALPSGAEPPAGPRRDRPGVLVNRAELGAVAVGRLEVV